MPPAPDPARAPVPAPVPVPAPLSFKDVKEQMPAVKAMIEDYHNKERSASFKKLQTERTASTRTSDQSAAENGTRIKELDTTFGVWLRTHKQYAIDMYSKKTNKKEVPAVPTPDLTQDEELYLIVLWQTMGSFSSRVLACNFQRCRAIFKDVMETWRLDNKEVQPQLPGGGPNIPTKVTHIAAKQPPVGEQPPVVPAVIDAAELAAEQPLVPTVSSSGVESAILPYSDAMASSTVSRICREPSVVGVRGMTTEHLYMLGAIECNPMVVPAGFEGGLQEMPLSKCSTYNLGGLCKVYLTKLVYYTGATFAYRVANYVDCKLQLDHILAEALRFRQEGGSPDSRDKSCLNYSSISHQEAVTTTRMTTITAYHGGGKIAKEVVESRTVSTRTVNVTVV